MKSRLHRSGTTTDDKPVYAGVFPLFGTNGIPLDLILSVFKKEGWVVDWTDFVKGAFADGHKPERLVSRITEGVQEVYGNDYANEVEKRLHILMKKLKAEGAS